MHWRPNLFVPPAGNAANDLAAEMARLITSFAEKTPIEKVALTAFFLLPHLILQLPASRRAAAKCRAMMQRLEMWREGNIEELLEEGRAIQDHLRISNRETSWQRGFNLSLIHI